jgi:hypothetical protein
MKFEIAERVFFLLFAVIILFTAYRIFHTHTILENNDSPTTVVHLFDLNNDLLYNVVTIFSIILLIISNIYYWRTERGIFFLWSILYFMAGIIFIAFLENARFHYIRENGIWKGEFSSGFVVSVYLIATALAVTLFNFIIIKFLKTRSQSKKRRI